MAYPMISKLSKTPARPASSGSGAPTGGGSKSEANGSWLKGLVTLIIVVIIIGGGLYLIASYTGLGSGLLPGESSFKAKWQAVFLSNGQVYFGQIVKVDREFVYLENIYYLQVINLEDTIGQPPDVQTQPEQQLTLIKLGNEIHGPQDEMRINRDHVIIIENLKDDSRVVQAINDYVKPSTGQ